jgi:CRP-like cAMP-binding protein
VFDDVDRALWCCEDRALAGAGAAAVASSAHDLSEHYPASGFTSAELGELIGPSRSVRYTTTIGAGACFGEVAMLTERRRSADVIATRETLCLEIPFDALQGTVQQKLLTNLAAHLARKVVADTELLQRIA